MTLPIHYDLTNKVAVVTGAGGVLCSGFAKVLSTCGAKIALLDLDLDAALSVERAIEETGGQAKAYRADVLDVEVMKDVARQVEKDLGPCDILINGAGGNHPRATTDQEIFQWSDLDADIKSFFNLDPQSIGFVFNLNFLGTLIPTQCFAKQMQGGGVIINISSMNAYTPLTKIPAYSGAKAAISNFTQWLAVYFAEVGIRVNAIAPGFFLTKQNKLLLFDQDNQPTKRTEKILSATPMGRFGEPEELTGALLFLVSDEASSFVTGTVLPVDGGFSAYSGV